MTNAKFIALLIMVVIVQSYSAVVRRQAGKHRSMKELWNDLVKAIRVFGTAIYAITKEVFAIARTAVKAYRQELLEKKKNSKNLLREDELSVIVDDESDKYGYVGWIPELWNQTLAMK